MSGACIINKICINVSGMIIAVLALSCLNGAIAQENNAKTGLSFLEIAVGARASGMGEAYTAVSSDAYSTYWNPAGLMGSKNNNAVFVHNNWIFDARSEFGALHFAGEKSSLAFHINALNVDGFEVRNQPTANALAETGAVYFSLGSSYARQIGKDFSAGITAKYLFEKIFVEDARGYAVDLGVRYTGLTEAVTVAAVLQNLGSMNNLRNQATELPMAFRAGLAWDVPVKNQTWSAILATDFVMPKEKDPRFHVGGELQLFQQLFLRTGFLSGYEARALTAGIGIYKGAFMLDYSFTPIKEDLGNGHRFSLGILL